MHAAEEGRRLSQTPTSQGGNVLAPPVGEHLPLLGVNGDGVEGDLITPCQVGVNGEGGKEAGDSKEPPRRLSGQRQNGSNANFNSTNIPDHLRKRQLGQ